MVTSVDGRDIEVQNHVGNESCLVAVSVKVVVYIEGDAVRSCCEVTTQQIGDPAVVVSGLARLQHLVLPIHPPESNVNSGCGFAPFRVEDMSRDN